MVTSCSVEGSLLDKEHLGVDSFFTLGVSESHVCEPGLGPLAALHYAVTGVCLGNRVGALGRTEWLTSGSLHDGSVNLLVESFKAIFADNLGPSGELFGEFLSVVFLECLVVLFNVPTKDVLSVFLGIEGLFGLFDFGSFTSLVGNKFSLSDVETWESLVLVGDVESTVTGSFHGSENTVSGGGSDETNIEVCLEWASIALDIISAVVGSINFVISLEHGVHVFSSEKTTGTEETSAVGGCVVGQSSGKSMSSEFLRVSCAHNLVTGEGGEDNLADDLFVGSTDTESVFS